MNNNSKPIKNRGTNKKNMGSRALIRFFATFALLMILFYLVYNSSFYTKHIMPILLGTQAKISSALLSIMGFGTTALKETVYNDSFRVDIRGGCDGLEGTALFVAGVLSFPFASWKSKLKGLLLGVLILGIVNIVRIVILFLSGLYWPSAFEFLHLHGGVILYSIFAVLLWIIWVNRRLQERLKGQSVS